MNADDLVVTVLSGMLVATVATWTAWRVVRTAQRQRHLELVWRERLAVWSRGAEGGLPRR
ncbi:MAG: hypothetical protein ACHQ52_05335 [Candidatus Eisenbacteria bacterium]